MSDPYLTIILTGRNDDFGGDFNGRLFSAAEFNHRQLLNYGISHEYVFVEWSPIPGKPYLSEILKAQLPWWDRLYVVDPAWHRHFCVNPKLVFMEFFAKNVGLRRASGRLVLTTNTDIWLSRGVLQALAHGTLDGGTVHRCVRVDLNREIGYEGVTFDVLEHADSFLRSNLVLPELYTNGAGDFILLDRASYLDIGGFNEVYRVSKIHKDANFCHKAHARGYPLQLIGEVYHFDHDSSWVNVMGLYENHHADAPFGPSNWNWTMHYDNCESWGLRDAPEQVGKDGIVFIGSP
jgi:hypothetical protein